MFIFQDPDAFVSVGGDGFYALRPATPAERRENRRKRLSKRVAELRKELAKAESELRSVSGPEEGT